MNEGEITSVMAVVKGLLESSESCRNDDDFLYLEVLKSKGLDVDSITLSDWYADRKEYRAGTPSFESVRRSRQWWQQHESALGPTDVSVIAKRKRIKKSVESELGYGVNAGVKP